MFSVLMSLYHGSCAVQLERCLLSFYDCTVIPSEIVIVFDGPVSDDVVTVIGNHGTLPIRSFATPSNQGLGPALNFGLSKCTNELVARMDTDDAVRKHRFEKQLAVFSRNANLTCLGCYIEEHDDLAAISVSRRRRKVPLTKLNFRIFSFFRNPMNHVTVMFKRSALQSVGGYPDILYREDYALWHLLLVRGFQLSNIDHVAVDVTADDAMVARRSGLINCFVELKFFLFRARTDFLYSPVYFVTFLIRAGAVIMPSWIIKRAYSTFLRSLLFK